MWIAKLKILRCVRLSSLRPDGTKQEPEPLTEFTYKRESNIRLTVTHQVKLGLPVWE